jgi:hypothetical protein
VIAGLTGRDDAQSKSMASLVGQHVSVTKAS